MHGDLSYFLTHLNKQTYIAVVAGISSIIYATFLINKHKRRGVENVYKEIMTWSALIAVVVIMFAALQIECMITGGCILSSWTQTCVIIIACIIYLVTLRRFLLKQKNHRDIDVKLTPFSTANSVVLDTVVSVVKDSNSYN